MNDSFTTAEKRGYAKGYRAGRHKRAREVSHEKRRRQENAFWQRAFVAAIPSFMVADNWTVDGKPVATLSARIDLAAQAADLAVTTIQERQRT